MSAPTHTHHTARNGSTVKILYPYHPLVGRELEIFGSAASLRDIVYVRLPNDTTRGIPAWMFDEVVCATIRTADRPVIDCGALLKLGRLLDSQREQAPTAEHEPSASASSKSGLSQKSQAVKRQRKQAGSRIGSGVG